MLGKKLFLLSGLFFVMEGYAEIQNTAAYPLMTSQDVRNNAASNITLINHTGQPISVSGLFIASFDNTQTSGGNCSMCYGSIVSGDNVSGAMVSPVRFNVNQPVPIGQNFLYNMIYNGIYYIQNSVGSSPCSLPGCSWPGDNRDAREWCLSINAISRNTQYTYSHYTNGTDTPAAVPAYSAAGSSNAFDYNYDLINPNTLGVGNACLGPITCDDQTLTCRVETPQNEVFEPYTS